MAESDTPYIPASAMVIVAHPDDAEFMTAGTAAVWAGAGAELTYVIVTNGNKGSEDRTVTPSELARVREAEQRDAGRILGVKNFEFLGYEDGYLQHTLDLRRELTRVIRKYRPEVVICFDPTTRFMMDIYPNHPDHRASGDATVDAVYPSARDHLTFPELLTDGYETHKVKQLWMGSSEQPNVWVDISGVLGKKREALLAHPSQLGPEAADMMDEWAARAAEGQPMSHAEAFRRIILDEDPVATE